MEKISVLVLTKNNEDYIENCLRSVYGWAKEIIIIDAGSQDQTLEICKKYQSVIYHHQWNGFSPQRDYAAKKASYNWLFYLDSDERVSQSLKEEINNLKENRDNAGYRVIRENIILGKNLKKGGWYPDRQIRLINKKSLEKWQGNLHEFPIIKGKIKDLRGSIYHLTHRGINWCLKKTIIYTDEVARLLFEGQHPNIKWWHLLIAPAREFYKRGIKEKGIFEGLEGLITVIYSTFDTFITYAKVWELQKHKTMDQVYRRIDKKLFREGNIN